MADFCRQCTRQLFDTDDSDFKGIVSEENFKKGLCAIGICEGCGGGEFDHDGYCLGCDEHENIPPEERLK